MTTLMMWKRYRCYHLCSSVVGFNHTINSTLCKVFLSTQPSLFSSCQLDLLFRRLICSRKRKFRVSRQPAEGCPNTRKYFILSHFSLFTSVPLTAKLPSPHGSSGYAECLCHFLVYGNKSTAVSLFEPFAGICLLTFTYKNHVRMNYKLIGIGSNYFIILLYRIIRNMCNKVFIGIFSTLSLCHKYAWCDRH